jgi:hypothetical protein
VSSGWPGWNKHGWWIGPADLEPERKPRKAPCGGPKACVICGEDIQWPMPHPDGLPLSKCNFCDAVIIWALTIPNPNARTAAKRKEQEKVPFDAEPSEHGLHALTRQKEGPPLCGPLTRVKAAAFRAAGQKTYLKHVKTCPNVAKWRKGQYIVAAREKAKG